MPRRVVIIAFLRQKASEENPTHFFRSFCFRTVKICTNIFKTLFQFSYKKSTLFLPLHREMLFHKTAAGKLPLCRKIKYYNKAGGTLYENRFAGTRLQ